MKIGRIKILIILLVLFCVFPIIGQAAEINLSLKDKEIKLNQQFEVLVSLDTQDESINAIEGKLLYPDKLLELKEIKNANSIINFWVEKPHMELNGVIVFSGITPGGYKGENGLIFSLIFESQNAGNGNLEISDTKVLLNDGEGTRTNLSLVPLGIFISEEISQDQISYAKDDEKPESFAPEVSSVFDIFEGKEFLVFITQDKGSGIDHYEIKETRQRFLTMFSDWIPAESPYILQDQELSSYIFVKAVDKFGNKRIEKITPQNPIKWYRNYENWIIIVIVLILACIIRKILWEKINLKF